jgi:molybdate transport system substrate-binding protein
MRDTTSPASRAKHGRPAGQVNKEDAVSRARQWMMALVAALVLALAAAGCGKQETASNTRGPKTATPTSNVTQGQETGTVVALVPCGQIGPFTEIASLFRKQNPGVKLEWTRENMVPIIKKIVDGEAKPDAVLSMGDVELNVLDKKGLLVEGSRVAYAENALAITVPAKNPAGVVSFADLTKPAVKAIAVPDPKMNSVGAHGVEALKGSGMWSQVERKVLVPQFAAESKEATAKGKVQATIGYYPCVSEVHIPGQAPVIPENIKIVSMVPANTYPTFSCEGAVVKGAKNPEGGRKLLALLKTPEAQEIFRKWNFVRQPKGVPAG